MDSYCAQFLYDGLIKLSYQSCEADFIFLIEQMKK